MGIETSLVATNNLFLANAAKLGLHALHSLDRLARNAWPGAGS